MVVEGTDTICLKIIYFPPFSSLKRGWEGNGEASGDVGRYAIPGVLFELNVMGPLRAKRKQKPSGVDVFAGMAGAFRGAFK